MREGKVNEEKKEKKKKKKGEDIPADGRVRVAVRIRPTNKADHNDTSRCLTVDKEINKITADNGQKNAAFTYDFVFHDDSQEEVCKCVLHSALGYF